MSEALKPLTPSELADLKAKAKAAPIYSTAAEWAVLYDNILRLIAMVERRDAWQPIETAPKDGTDILLYLPGAAQGLTVVIGHWSACDELPEDDAWYPTTPGSADPFDIDPTHWQPLPTPPGEALAATEPLNDKR